MKRRTWPLEQKMAIVLEGFKGTSSVSELCRKYQISQTLYYRWRDIFMEGGQEALVNGKSDRNKALEAKIAEYEQIIGQKTVELSALKKTLNWEK